MSNEELVVPDKLLQVSAAAHQSEQKVAFCGEKAKDKVHECAGDGYSKWKRQSATGFLDSACMYFSS